MKNYHITKAQDKSGWALKKEGAERASIKAPTKAAVIQATREFMQDKQGSVKIHKGDGKFQEERTYPRSADPVKSRG